MAIDATITKEPQAVGELRGGGAMSIRYSGFDQRNDTRSYVFQYLVLGEKARPIVVSAEIALFLTHHVRIQDGPALCLHTLMSETSGVDLSQAGTLQRQLTAQDVLAYLASQPLPAQAKGKREKRTEV
jgi:hypothetical protein